MMDMKSGMRLRDHDFNTDDKAGAYYHPNLRRPAGSIDFARAAEERHCAI